MKKIKTASKPRPKVVLTIRVENITLIVTENADSDMVRAAVKAIEKQEEGAE